MKKAKLTLATISVESFTTVSKNSIKGGAEPVGIISSCIPEDCRTTTYETGY